VSCMKTLIVAAGGKDLELDIEDSSVVEDIVAHVMSMECATGEEVVYYKGMKLDPQVTIRKVGIRNRDKVELRPPGDAPLELSNYGQHYNADKAVGTTYEVWQAIDKYLVALYELKGHTKDDTQNAAQSLRTRLDKDVNDLTKAETADNTLLQKLLKEPGWIVARCWTSTEVCDITKREFCGLLQEGIRLDSPSLMPMLVAIFATMSRYTMATDAKRRSDLAAIDRVDWPLVERESSCESKWTLHRGGRLPQRCVAWFEEAIENKTIYRVKMALPTTKIGTKAIDFMSEYSYPEGEPKAYWRYHLDPTLRCRHVNCLEAASRVKEEQEFCFPPYSAFRATELQWVSTGGYYVIDVEVIHDNKSAAQDGPVPINAPIAPWA